MNACFSIAIGVHYSCAVDTYDWHAYAFFTSLLLFLTYHVANKNYVSMFSNNQIGHVQYNIYWLDFTIHSSICYCRNCAIGMT